MARGVRLTTTHDHTRLEIVQIALGSLLPSPPNHVPAILRPSAAAKTPPPALRQPWKASHQKGAASRLTTRGKARLLRQRLRRRSMRRSLRTRTRACISRGCSAARSRPGGTHGRHGHRHAFAMGLVERACGLRTTVNSLGPACACVFVCPLLSACESIGASNVRLGPLTCTWSAVCVVVSPEPTSAN